METQTDSGTIPRRSAVEGEIPQRRTAEGRPRGHNYGNTRQQQIDVWSRAVARDLQRGTSIFQKPQTLQPPQSLPSVGLAADGRVERRAPNTFRGTNAIILRTVAAHRGLADSRFLMPEAARRFNDQHGSKVPNPIVNRSGRIDLPNSNSRADDPYVERHEQRLAEDGKNFDVHGNEVDGKEGDVRRYASGQPVLEDVVYDGYRRDAGVREYYNVDDLRLPARQPRPEPRQDRHDRLMGSLEGAAKRQSLEIVEAEDLKGRAELNLVGDVEPTFQLRVGPEDSFESPEQRNSVVVRELCRFAACRDGQEDALAVVRAKPEDRPGMPEFARSELVASAASMELMTAAGHTWHPPTYAREHKRDIVTEQVRFLREPNGLARVGQEASRASRVAQNRAPTEYAQRERNRERRAEAPSVEAVARGFATRPAAPVPAAAAAATESQASTRAAAPAGPTPDEIADQRNSAAERAAAELYDGRKRSAASNFTPGDEPAAPTVQQVQAKLDQLQQAKPARPVTGALESQSFEQIVAGGTRDVPEPGPAPAPAAGAAASSGPDRGSRSK